MAFSASLPLMLASSICSRRMVASSVGHGVMGMVLALLPPSAETGLCAKCSEASSILGSHASDSARSWVRYS